MKILRLGHSMNRSQGCSIRHGRSLQGSPQTTAFRFEGVGRLGLKQLESKKKRHQGVSQHATKRLKDLGIRTLVGLFNLSVIVNVVFASFCR